MIILKRNSESEIVGGQNPLSATADKSEVSEAKKMGPG